MLKQLQHFGHKLRSIGVWFLLTITDWLLPANGKRMLFLTTLYTQLNNIKNPTPDQLTPLVNDLHLASKPQSLMFPASINLSIWDESTITEIKSGLQSRDESVIKSICIAIVNRTPERLQFGRKDDMVADMFSLLQHNVANNTIIINH
jgi:hypothetical protein